MQVMDLHPDSEAADDALPALALAEADSLVAGRDLIERLRAALGIDYSDLQWVLPPGLLDDGVRLGGVDITHADVTGPLLALRVPR